MEAIKPAFFYTRSTLEDLNEAEKLHIIIIQTAENLFGGYNKIVFLRAIYGTIKNLKVSFATSFSFRNYQTNVEVSRCG